MSEVKRRQASSQSHVYPGSSWTFADTRTLESQGLLATEETGLGHMCDWRVCGAWAPLPYTDTGAFGGLYPQ